VSRGAEGEGRSADAAGRVSQLTRTRVVLRLTERQLVVRRQAAPTWPSLERPPRGEQQRFAPPGRSLLAFRHVHGFRLRRWRRAEGEMIDDGA
jgi:hypothetical protein